MDKRMLLALGISFLVFSLWQQSQMSPAPQQAVVAQTQNTQIAHSAIQPTPQKQPEVDTRKLESDLGTVTIGNGYKIIDSWTLPKFKISDGKKEKSSDKLIEVASITHGKGELELGFDSPEFLYLKDVRGVFNSNSQKVYWSYQDDKVNISREIAVNSK
jgi:hypothetical protein